jgi:hypothetical protein
MAQSEGNFSRVSGSTCAAQKAWNSNLCPSAICGKRYGKNTDIPPSAS